jgi:NAD(P)-dependent dehydrogenase (short-subunit alcohol dehydrogenase family)
MKRFENKVFVITGSTQGLGRALAFKVLNEGGQVALNGRKEAKKDEVLQQFASFQNRVIYVAADVTKSDEARKLIEATVAHFGRIDVLVNNAGMSAYGKLEDSNPSVIQEVVDSNLTGSLFASHYAIPHIKKTKGSIEFISSLAAIHGLGNYSLYSSVKMAYIGAVQSLKKELHDDGVHVGAIYLGFTKNDTTKRTLNANGELEAVPVRKGLPVASQDESAGVVLNQIYKRKTFVVQSALGKANFLVNRVLPRIIHAVLLNQFRKMTKD